MKRKMRKSQELNIQMSEARSKLNKAIEKRNETGEMTDEIRSEMRTATTQLEDLEIEYRAALQVEDKEDRIASLDGGESRELNGLLGQASIMPFLQEAVEGRRIEGAENELRQALLGDEARQGLLPIELLEERADAATTIAGSATQENNQANVLERVFTRSIAKRLMVEMPSVPVGAASYPVMLTGTSASMKNAGDAVDAEAATFEGFTLDPVRLTARYLFRIEDTYKMRGYENVLRRDLSAVMSDKMDDQIVNGDGTAPNVNGFIAELADPENPTAVITWASFVKTFTDKVDGLNAYDVSDVRAILGSETYSKVETIFRANATDKSAYEYVKDRVGGISVSSRIPDPASNVQKAIVALTSYPGRNAVAPVWKAVEIIRDPYSGAASGQVAITAIMLWNFKIIRETGFSVAEFKVA